MPARVKGLGHVGLYVRDLETMVAFYRDFLGMQVSMQDWDRGLVFLSSDPERVDHEVALIKGRVPDDTSKQIEQVSMRVDSLDDVREFHRKLVAGGYRIDKVVNHSGAIGCYYFDPEGNRSEVFWDCGVHSDAGMPFLEVIDIEEPNDVLLGRMERARELLRQRKAAKAAS